MSEAQSPHDKTFFPSAAQNVWGCIVTGSWGWGLGQRLGPCRFRSSLGCTVSRNSHSVGRTPIKDGRTLSRCPNPERSHSSLLSKHLKIEDNSVLNLPKKTRRLFITLACFQTTSPLQHQIRLPNKTKAFFISLVSVPLHLQRFISLFQNLGSRPREVKLRGVQQKGIQFLWRIHEGATSVSASDSP